MQGQDALNGYLTVQNTGECEYIVQKSRFIGRCFPVAETKQAESILADLRKRYWEATHNCYAFRLGKSGEIARSSDDGEPSGTAGAPILQCMNAIGVTDALVVVTRYFGGILLGAGGLVRAYSHTASESVRQAGLVRMTPCRDIHSLIPYSLWTTVERCFRDSGAHAEQVQYSESVTAHFWIAETDAENLIHRIVDLTDGRVVPRSGEIVFRPVPASAVHE